MQMKMTSRDKLLLSILSIVLILVAFVNYLITPAMKRMDDLDLEISDAEMEQQEMQLKIAMLPEYQKNYADLQQAAADETAQYYDRMTSQEVDRELTNIVLAHGLESVELSIQPLAFTVAEPYSRSELARAQALQEAAEAAAEAEAEAETEKAPVTDAIEEGMQNQRDAYEEAASAYENTEHPVRVDVQDQIYTCAIQLSVEGGEENYQSLIDTLVNSYPSIRVTGISYQEGQSRMRVLSDGSTELEEGRRQLMLDLEMYMCDKSLYAQFAAQSGTDTSDQVNQVLDTVGGLLSAAQQQTELQQP